VLYILKDDYSITDIPDASDVEETDDGEGIYCLDDTGWPVASFEKRSAIFYSHNRELLEALANQSKSLCSGA
jgi:hypothetical protein